MNPVTSSPVTSTIGIGTLITAALSIYGSISTHTMPDTNQLSTLAMGVLAGIGFLFSKDWNTTGGTK